MNEEIAEGVIFDGVKKEYTGRKFRNKISCYQCGLTTSRNYTIVATVKKMTEKRIIVELTEPEERLMSVDGHKPFAFPFYLREGGIELQVCSLNCLRNYINEATK